MNILLIFLKIVLLYLPAIIFWLVIAIVFFYPLLRCIRYKIDEDPSWWEKDEDPTTWK
jgi:hypothetical protein